MFTEIKETIKNLDVSKIDASRLIVLDTIANSIQDKIQNNEIVNLIFICTHNSRRSQLTQVWAKTLAEYYGVDINSYSGGVEETAFKDSAYHTLIKQGFKVEVGSVEDSNPLISISYSLDKDPMNCFSKEFDAESNPKNNFIAIMTCSDADENCPFIPGAEKRLPLRYNDPKTFDNTDLESEKYLETVTIIATELKYVFSKLNK